MRPFFQKLNNLYVFRNKAIRHMWRVANGLDNAGISEDFFSKILNLHVMRETIGN
jgi:hypothetical protein